ncbi:C-C motif chemokine 25 [Phycodurus eques]|uniref:C-C motif chemokine 25 n=1 Tax=Phycodurus eques TaxID=693459 RepID=UPI002ACEF94A|nr:C-C motif chemokine 25 [Phycodurus eques]XP_061550566.1 C-C motif chemokine 25 [Phycodurus eques]XP_061550567.1 C-C motif chemokine 25 [Phycodurus eques]
MRLETPLILLVLSCLSLAMAQVSYDDCCLTYVKELTKRIRERAVKYRIQETDGGCNIRAVIFTMRKGRMYCCDPQETWVQELMSSIYEKAVKHIKKTSPKHQRRRLFG